MGCEEGNSIPLPPTWPEKGEKEGDRNREQDRCSGSDTTLFVGHQFITADEVSKVAIEMLHIKTGVWCKRGRKD